MHTSYPQYVSQSLLRAESINQSEYVSNNQVAVVAQKRSQRLQISPLLPQNVVSTLNQKEQVLENYKAFVSKNKAALDHDIDEFLKQIIRMFEELKEQLFLKMDDQVLAFNKIFEQYEKIALDCSDWAEQKIGSSNFQNDMKSSVSDLLHQGLHQARFQKQKADEIEKSLLAIKQKIDSSKLQELNDEIKSLADERNQLIYVPEEARGFYDSLKASLKTKIGQLNQSKIVPPFSVGLVGQQGMNNMEGVFYEQDIREPKGLVVQNRDSEQKTNLTGLLQQVFNKDTERQMDIQRTEVQTTGALPRKVNQSNFVIRDPNEGRVGPVNEGQKCGIIAQQNQFYSDEITLTNPIIKQEKEITFKVKARINNVMSLINNVVLFGAEDGSLVILNLTNDLQSTVKAHTSGVRGMTKANESLVLTSAVKPDTALKLWDFGPILSTKATDEISKNAGNVLLVGVLKGLNETAIGHAFITENLIMGVGEEGQIVIWDWKSGLAVAQSKTEYSNLNAFVMFSDRENFAVSTTEGFVQSYCLVRDGKSFLVTKISEYKESSPVVGLYTFRGNNDIIITALGSGDVKLMSRKSKMNYHTIVGCKSPVGFFVLNSIRNESNIYLMSLEPYGFKLADIDGRDFTFMNTQSFANFKAEKIGWPAWQIVDSVFKEKLTFVTINSGKEPNDAILWSLNGNK